MATFWFEHALLPGGWAEHVRIATDGGLIESVETDVRAGPGDDCGAIALPGLCNVHSHGFQRGMAGLSEHRGASDDDFWSWREVMYRFLDRLTPDDIEAICALAYVEMLETGYTRVGEFHYLHNDPAGRSYDNPAELAERVISASMQAGIGLTLLPVFYAHSDFGGTDPRPGQRRFITGLDGFSGLIAASARHLPADAVMGMAPHSLRAVTPAELAVLLQNHTTGPVHIHAAEQIKEVEASLAFSGQRPVAWLLDHAPVDTRWCLIHATHLEPAEVQGLAASGAVAGLCPVTEANLGDGIFPAVEFLGAGGRIATGTDSNILIDPAGELRALEYSQRLAHRARNLLARESRPSVGRNLFDATLRGGAQALGTTCGISPGHPADFFSLDANHPALGARTGDALIDSWIFAGRAGCIDGVWRGGVKRVSQGRHHERDAVVHRYNAVLRGLLAA